MLLHGGGAVTGGGLTVSAKIGKNHTVLRGEHTRHRQPEFVVDREGVQQDDWRSVAENVAGNFRVAAADLIHAG